MLNKNKTNVIGIDLGTTYSVVAGIDDAGKPFSIRNQDGDITTPSALFVEEDAIIVGREAVNAASLAPNAYADCFKRDVGNQVYRHPLRGIATPPQILNALVLDQLRSDAERSLGQISKAVITVPAFFDEARRKATQDAGRIAGLDVIDIINEPTAAALAYGYQNGLLNTGHANEKIHCNVLVYDLGGGTFDVTILEISGTTYRAIATDGDVQLGGKDFDERIVNYLSEQFLKTHGADPRTDPQDETRLWAEAQRIKHTLSQRTKTPTTIYHGGKRLDLELSRQQFEFMTRDLLDRTETTMALVLREAKMDWSQIDRVLLVGGSTRMPAVSEMIRRVTGTTPDSFISPDEAVAHGAAIHAAMLTRHESSSLLQCHLINVNSHSLGISAIDNLTKRRVNGIMIPRNTPLPCKQVKTFTTSKPDQRSVMVVVLEGEGHHPDDCIRLGECVIRDLPPGLPAGSKVEVTYSYDSDGRVTVSARIPQTRQSAHVEIRRSNSTDLEDLDTWRKRLLAHAVETAPGQHDEDPGNILRKLDQLYGNIGNTVLKGGVPDILRSAHSAAQSAIANYHAISATLKQIQTNAMDANSIDATARLSTQALKCKHKVEQAFTVAKFACIVLGRECVKHEFIPDIVKDAASEVRRLRVMLEK